MAKDPYKYFRLEARELIDGLSRGILELERGEPDRDLMPRLLRLAHTLKGAARVVKLGSIAGEAHAVEDALASYRGDGSSAPKASIAELLAITDRMSKALLGIDAAPSEGDTTSAAPRNLLDAPIESVRIEIEEMDALLRGVTEAAVRLHSLEQESALLERARHLAQMLVDEATGHREGADADRTLRRTGATAQELTNSLARLGRNVASGVEQVSRELAQVRDAAHRLRLLPSSSIFGPLERAARDAAQVLDKKVTFRASGGDGRVDAHVLASVRAALVHVVRNAVAHGIESEGERVAAGKPPTGQVTLDIERRGNKIAFICRDDGRGVDVERVRREAVRTGIVSATQASSLQREEVFRLLLRGGLTTTKIATEVSGRGIGLDAVRETAARLRGEIMIASEAGQGATFELCVPVSLSSLPALLVDAGGITAVVPLDSVRKTVRIAESDIARSAESSGVLYEGRIIPFIPLSSALGHPTALGQEQRVWSAMIVESARGLAAVGVDRLLGTSTVVVRPLPPHMAAEPLVAGASLDDQGNPQLVIDPDGLVVAAAANPLRRSPRVEKRLPLLVIDDSLTTRMLEQSILESAGYEVEVAVSAEDGLEKAARRRYGVFLVDVEMPGMDGFAFVAETRANPALRETPRSW